jgi:cystathionine gamma-synthase
MAAVSGVLMALKSMNSAAQGANTCVLLPDDCYHGVPHQLITVLETCGIQWQAIDMTNEEAVHSALLQQTSNKINKNNVMLWLETPSNPLCKVSDIKRLSSLAKSIDPTILITVDSTWSPPTITRPLELGADCVLHSATKYMGGHSDVLMGVTTCRGDSETSIKLRDQIRAIQTSVGAVPSAFDCFLVLRGLRSMHLRVERSSTNAMRVANYLADHPLVSKVHYPGLKTHPQHEVAAKQMRLFGGMLSFEVGSQGVEQSSAQSLAAELKLITMATSLGGTETLIEHRASIEPEGRVTSPLGLLRVSVGIEDYDDLEQDLEQAFDRADIK